MTRLRLRSSRPLWAALLFVLASAGSGVGAPAPLVAQTVPDLQEPQADYNLARSQLVTAREAQRRQEILWQQALSEGEAARRAGDSGRADAADRRAWAASAEVGRLRQQVEEREADLARAREALEAALERQMELIAGQIPRATPRAADTLRALFSAYEDQHSILRAEATAETSRPRSSFLSNIVPELNPLWPPDVKLAQIDLLDRRVQDLRADIARVDDEIAGVETRIDRRRRLEESAVTSGRFGATDPVGTNRSRGPGGTTPVEVPTGPISAEQELEFWQTLKSELELLIRTLEFRVADFRRSVPGAGGW